MNKFLLLICFVFLFSWVGVLGVQEPAGWWDVSTNVVLSGSFNITNEINQTSANLTLGTGTVLNIINSKLNFTKGQLISTNTNSITNILNSQLFGGNPSNPFNRLRFTYTTNNPFVFINNSIINGFNTFSCNSVLGNFTIRNTNISNNHNNGIQSASCNNIIIDNIQIKNISGTSDSYGLWIQGNNNAMITNLFINNTGSHALRGTSGNVNTTIINLKVYNSGGTGTFFQEANNTIIKHSILNNITLYGYDFLGYGNNHLVENSTVDGYGESFGIAFSFGDTGIGFSFNLTSRDNKIYNGIATGALSFNNLNDGFSYNDYIENVTGRGLSITTAGDIGIYNLTIKNAGIESVKIHVNSYNVLIDNVTIINPNITFNFRQSENITIKNSLINSLEDHYSTIDGVIVKNITFINVLGHSFFLENATDLDFNLSSSRKYFKSVGSDTNTIQLKQLTNALIYFSNGSVACSDISTCDGNINITLTPNNFSFVLDDFSLTEGVTRQNSPIAFSSTTDFKKSITSTLTDTIDVTITFNVADCDTVGTITYTSDTGAFSTIYTPGTYTCTNEVISLDIIGIETATSSNEINIEYNQAQLNACSDMLMVFATYPALIGLVGTILFLGVIVMLLTGFGKFKEGVDKSLLFVGILMLVGIAVLVIISIVIIQTLCSTF